MSTENVMQTLVIQAVKLHRLQREFSWIAQASSNDLLHL